MLFEANQQSIWMIMTTSNSKSPKRGRGRPQGSMGYPEDGRLLKNAEQLLALGHAKTATQAFKIVTDGDEAAIRRLQRKWKLLDSEKA